MVWFLAEMGMVERRTLRTKPERNLILVNAVQPFSHVDVSGKLRIWDTVNKDHILKYEYQPFAGPIKDVSWSPDSKRIAICGEGRQT